MDFADAAGSFSGGGVALGAALLPFLNTLLLPPASA